MINCWYGKKEAHAMRSNPHKSDKQTKSNKPIEVHNKTGKCHFFWGLPLAIRSNRPFSFCFFNTKKKTNQFHQENTNTHYYTFFIHKISWLKKNLYCLKKSPKSLEKVMVIKPHIKSDFLDKIRNHQNKGVTAHWVKQRH